MKSSRAHACHSTCCCPAADGFELDRVAEEKRNYRRQLVELEECQQLRLRSATIEKSGFQLFYIIKGRSKKGPPYFHPECLKSLLYSLQGTKAGAGRTQQQYHEFHYCPAASKVNESCASVLRALELNRNSRMWQRIWCIVSQTSYPEDTSIFVFAVASGVFRWASISLKTCWVAEGFPCEAAICPHAGLGDSILCEKSMFPL